MEDQRRTWKWEKFEKLTDPVLAPSERWFCRQ